MARIILPEDFLHQMLLLKNVKEKFDSIPLPANPLAAYLAQQGIDLAADDIARETALDFEKERREKSGKAENRTQQRDLKFDPVFAHLRDYYQFLKKFYKPNFMQISEWGAPITVSGRIAYPPEFSERLAIFKLLKEKYDSFMPPGTSPLDPYLNLYLLSIITQNMDVDDAADLHEAAKAFHGQAEDATQDRNNVWNPVMEHLRDIGGFLMSLYTNNPKELNEWGYVVDDSPRAPKQVVSKVKLGSAVTVGNCIIGGTFKNIGNVALLVYKGKTATGASVNVLPGETYGITKGFSTITVVNTSSTTTAVFSALRSK